MAIDGYDGYVFDLDGVVWRGTAVVPGVPEAINSLKAAGRSVRFLTNNASQHRTRQCDKLRSMGVNADPHEVLTSGSATAMHLRSIAGASRVHVMGTPDLEREMRDAGHEVAADNADFVVVGLDREFSYAKLDAAFNCVYYGGSTFVACNEDETYPDKDRLRPGAGACVAALAGAVGRRPDIVVGKPHLPMMLAALESLGLPPERCLMTGDKLDTDVRGALSVGMHTLYVLTGKGTEADIEAAGITPHYVAPSAANLLLPKS